MAAEYLLELYSAFGFLLAVGQKEVEKRRDGAFGRTVGKSCDICVNAGKSCPFWYFDLSWKLYAADGCAASIISEQESYIGKYCFFWVIFVNQKYQKRKYWTWSLETCRASGELVCQYVYSVFGLSSRYLFFYRLFCVVSLVFLIPDRIFYIYADRTERAFALFAFTGAYAAI